MIILLTRSTVLAQVPLYLSTGSTSSHNSISGGRLVSKDERPLLTAVQTNYTVEAQQRGTTHGQRPTHKLRNRTERNTRVGFITKTQHVAPGRDPDDGRCAG